MTHLHYYEKVLMLQDVCNGQLCVLVFLKFGQNKAGRSRDHITQIIAVITLITLP